MNTDQKTQTNAALTWQGSDNDLTNMPEGVRACLLNLDQPVYVVNEKGKEQFSNNGAPAAADGKSANLIGWLPPLPLEALGDPTFAATYGCRAAYYAGGMANAIASEELVIALGKAGLLGSFGSGGLSQQRLAQAVDTIQAALPQGPYMFNLLHNPFEPEMEQGTVDLFLQKKVRAVEAAAYLRLTPALVQYRAAGLSQNSDGSINIANHVIGKVSRREITLHFLNPAPEKMLAALVEAGKITAEQAELAQQVPMGDDITVEGDSGGHTDNRPTISLLPGILALRDQTQAQNQFAQPVRIGAGGGISTPASALAAFMMGAAYVVSGSVNQACTESGACEYTRQILAKADMADVGMAPSADMFELGARVQVLKKGSLFAMRAQKLYDLYTSYESLEDIPAEVREELETKVFQRKIDEIWQGTKDFFAQRNPEQIAKAEASPKKKMALVFRWYLGLSSRWSRDGVEERRMDYQIWCGPSMGAFNEWVRGTYLEDYSQRHVTDVAWQLMRGAAYTYRVQALKMQGVSLPVEAQAYLPQPQP